MVRLKIRFVAICNDFSSESKCYLIQRKTLFGWRYINYCYGEGDRQGLSYSFLGSTKESLLLDVLDCRYKNKRVEIIEYPTIRKYTINKK